MKTLDDLIRKKRKYFNCVEGQDMTFDEIETLIRETAKVTIGAVRPVTINQCTLDGFSQGVQRGNKITVDEFDRKATAFMGEK